MFGRSDKSISTDDAIASFQQKIAAHEDIVYGVALFFECLNLVHEMQGAIVETHRKQFRNIIQKGSEATQRAAKLLDEVRQDPKKVQLLRQFVFASCQDHPQPAEMVRRAEILVATYQRIFPDRPRSQDFSRAEIVRLLEEASEAFTQAAAPTREPSRPQAARLP
ncbi:MAG: hypothetical protein C0404_05340 [Verrucomicrobia bacterium]|nr:hypothetical protein [Verrucomicrobiota bacterium]